MPDQPSLTADSPPEWRWTVRITPPAGRLPRYHLQPHYGTTPIGVMSSVVWGRTRAERKARRIIARQEREARARANAWNVTGGSL